MLAISLVEVSISMLEKVAPRRPSRPVRPPMTTIKSPSWACVRCVPRGIRPTQPQNTSGFAV